MTEQSHAVFLSYASQDVEAAKRICEALRAAGIEVFLDQSELRGGEAWDRKIRKEIHDCALFIPVISANAHARDEGYFRLEWKLAVDRSHLMSPDKTFLLPVVIDNTPQTDERIPDRFRELQWSRLPDGQVPPQFIERVQRLLSPAEPDAVTTIGPVTRSMLTATSVSGAHARVFWGPKRVLIVTGVLVILGALASVVVDRLWTAKKPAATPTPSAPQASAAPAAFSPPPHSIAVLPFVNMSGDKEQEYFSDGLTEELLNSLSRINELQVAGRTSSFYFKGEHVDLGTIARKLNVAAVLEGSVRRSGHTVRVTAQLNNGATGYHLWSETYDRDLKDVLKLQTEIANAVASALRVALLGDVAAKVEIGGTRNPAAFDAYLRGTKALTQHQADDLANAITAYTDAIRLDSRFALAFASRSLAHIEYGGLVVNGAAVRKTFDRALADARQAVALAPELAEGHAALGYSLETASLDFALAGKAYERARSLASGNAEVLRLSGQYMVFMGEFDAGLAALRRAVALDPLNPRSHALLGQGLYLSRRYSEAVAAYAEAIAVDPGFKEAYGNRGLPYIGVGDMEAARASCEVTPDRWESQWCLAVVYRKLGRQADAEAVLASFQASSGESSAYQYATIYAQWGDTSRALKWLETALHVRDPGLESLKLDPLIDPLRNEPRFEVTERALKFPQ